jgi:nitrous oxidase accessory protein NosD
VLVGIVGAIALILTAQGRSPGSGQLAGSSRPPSKTALPSASAARFLPCDASLKTADAANLRAASAKLGAGVLCLAPGRYEGRLVLAVEGQTWRLGPDSVLAGSIQITGPGAAIEGGAVELAPGGPWGAGVTVEADDVRLENIRFRGGGLVISVVGRDRVRILGNDFAAQTGAAIFLWGESGGSDDALIEGNHIVQTMTSKVSPIGSRGNEATSHGGVQNSGATIRNNTIDQGAGDLGWFGIELKQSAGAIIEGNAIRGGQVLVSLPESDGAIVRGNTLDLGGSAYWGVEVPNANDVVIEGNTIIGSGPETRDAAIALNSGSLRTTVRGNNVRDVRTLFAVSGDGHIVTDNCLTNVGHEFEYRTDGGPNITFARNGAC